jgi:hypothetical protein
MFAKHIAMSLTVALIALTAASCRHGADSADASVNSSLAGKQISVTNPVSLVGQYAMVEGDKECAAQLKIAQDDQTNPNTLSVYGMNQEGATAGGSQIFYDIGGEGMYSFNSSSSEWTWYKAMIDGKSLVQWEARAYFVKPWPLLAKETSRLTVDGGRIVFTGSMYSEELAGPKKFSCAYSY